MRLVYFGNNDRGVLCLRALMEHGHDVACVVALPDDRTDDRSGSVKLEAKRLGVPSIEPSDVNDQAVVKHLVGLQAELGVLSGYTRIVGGAIRASFSHGCINTHAGKLPFYRGPHPINWQIINGESVIGIAIIELDGGVDTGPILLQQEFPLGINDDASIVLKHTLELFPPMLVEAVRRISDGTIGRSEQDRNQGTQYTRRYPRDGIILWEAMTALQVHNLVRALARPFPGAFTYRGVDRLFVWQTELLDETIKGVPGRVALRRTNGVVVCASDRGLLVKRVQSEPQEAIDAREAFPVVGIDLTAAPN